MKLSEFKSDVQMAAIAPSSFGMPFCGHASVATFGTALATTGTNGTTGVATRERQADTTGDMGLAIAYVPGTTAWSPPIS